MDLIQSNILVGNLWPLTIQYVNRRLYLFYCITNTTNELGKIQYTNNSNNSAIVVYIYNRDGTISSAITIANFNTTLSGLDGTIPTRVKYNSLNNYIYCSIYVRNSVILSNGVNINLNNGDNAYIMLKLDSTNLNIIDYVIFYTKIPTTNDEFVLNFDIMNGKLYFTGTYNETLEIESSTRSRFIRVINGQLSTFYGIWSNNDINVKTVTSPFSFYSNLLIVNNNIYMVGSYSTSLTIDGTTITSPSNIKSLWLSKLDLNLNLVSLSQSVINIETIRSGDLFVCDSMTYNTNTNNIYLSGTVIGRYIIDSTETNPLRSVYLAQLNTDLNLIWFRQYLTYNKYVSFINQIFPTICNIKDNNVVLYGYYFVKLTQISNVFLDVLEGSGSSDLFALSFDSNGNITNSNSVTGIYSINLNNIVTSNNSKTTDFLHLLRSSIPTISSNNSVSIYRNR